MDTSRKRPGRNPLTLLPLTRNPHGRANVRVWKRLFLLLAVSVLRIPGAAAYDVTVVQSLHIEPYAEARRAFREAFREGLPPRMLREVQPVRFREFVLEEAGEREAATRHLEHEHTDLILAIGGRALSFAARFPATPVVYAMVPAPDSRVAVHPEVHGVPFHVAPEQWLDVTRKSLPRVQRIGVIYSPPRTGDFVEQARALAAVRGLALHTATVGSAHQVQDRLEDLAEKVDALWLLPDLAVVTPQTVEQILRYSLERRIPVLTFAERHLRRGALLSLRPDPRSMGRRAADVARSLLRGAEPSGRETRETLARSLRVEVNREVARRLELQFDTAWLNGAD